MASAVLMEGKITALHDDENDEFVIAYDPDDFIELKIPYRMAAERGFNVITQQWFDTDTNLQVLVLGKDHSL
jgi:hypothetical protein